MQSFTLFFWNSRCTGSYTPQGGPPSYPRTQESMAIPSVGSSPSVAPSPLPNPHSQPASVPPGDQTMPTLSPHPPTNNPSPAEKTHTPDHPPKSVESPGNSPVGQNDTKGEQPATVASVPVLKRPSLTSKEYEVALGEEEQTLEMLYDYSMLNAWLNHPIKKFKPDGRDRQRMSGLGKMDIYSMYENNCVVNQNCDPLNGKSSQMSIKQEIKSEPGQTVSLFCLLICFEKKKS